MNEHELAIDFDFDDEYEEEWATTGHGEEYSGSNR